MGMSGPRRALWTLGAAGTAAVVGLAFAAGRWSGGSAARAPTTFHDLRVSHAAEYTRLIQPSHPAVRSTAARLRTPQDAYYFVRDSIAFDPSTPSAPASDSLAAGRANCVGKAALLCSLYRALGAEAGETRVVVGEVKVAGRAVDHAWVDLEHGGVCLQQDPSDLVGYFEFADFEGCAYARWFAHRERFCFNDRGFAVVSPLNLLARKDSAPD